MGATTASVIFVIFAIKCSGAAVLPDFAFGNDYNGVGAGEDAVIVKTSNIFQENALQETDESSSIAVLSTGTEGNGTLSANADQDGRRFVQPEAKENPFAGWLDLLWSEPFHTTSAAVQSSHGGLFGFTGAKSSGTEGSTDTQTISVGNLGNGFTSGRADSAGNNGSAVGVGSSGGGPDCHAGTNATASNSNGDGSSVGASSSLCFNKDKLVISQAHAGASGFQSPRNRKTESFSHGHMSTTSFDLPGASAFFGPMKQTLTETKVSGNGEATADSFVNIVAPLPKTSSISAPLTPVTSTVPVMASSLQKSSNPWIDFWGSFSLPTPAPSYTVPTPTYSHTEHMPASSESLPTPASSESLPTPASSESLPTPASSESPPTPVSSESLPMPASSESLPTPDSSQSLPTPASSQSLPTPASSQSLPMPDSSHSEPTSTSSDNPNTETNSHSFFTSFFF